MMILARMTWAHSLRQPASLLACGLALILVLLSWTFGIFNFDDNDRLRLLATSGVAVARMCGLFLAVFLTSSAIHDELASRTALTLFAKPVSRGSYLFGRALGTWLAVCCLLAVIAIVHIGLFIYTAEHGFLARAHAQTGISAVDEVWNPWGRLIIAHLLGTCEAACLVALSAVLALRLPLSACILVMFSLFVGVNLLGAWGWHGALLLPGLSLFTIDEALQFADQDLDPSYFALSLAYAAIYACGSLSVGLALFERQDIP